MDWSAIIAKLLNPVVLSLLLALAGTIIGAVIAVRKWLKEKKINEAWKKSEEQRIKEEQDSREENQTQDIMAKKSWESMQDWKKRVRRLRNQNG